MTTDACAAERSFLRDVRSARNVREDDEMLTMYIIGYSFGVFAGVISMKLIWKDREHHESKKP
jgi:hypothetical protein